MLGRGIDQILPNPSDPTLYEPYATSAREYVALAEALNGEIQAPLPFRHVWGDALDVLIERAPDVRVVNLETAVTTNDKPWPGKPIHYRMHPANLPVLSAAGIDGCALANNHIMDWGLDGLEETLGSLEAIGIAHCGAGADDQSAAEPMVLATRSKQRVLVFAYGLASSGTPAQWRAAPDRAGVNWLRDLSLDSLQRVADAVAARRRESDMVVVSIHWGANWVDRVPVEHQRFARGLIDAGVADVIHGHSSHHPLGIEVYRNRPILYGCGDLLNDYEGIRGHRAYRPELVLMYFVTLASNGQLVGLEAAPMRISRFRLNHPSLEERQWLGQRIARQSKDWGTDVRLGRERTLEFSWSYVKGVPVWKPTDRP
jgi:poly-gamma-glutamate synthesis protein (capsule biosynthesis protein)